MTWAYGATLPQTRYVVSYRCEGMTEVDGLFAEVITARSAAYARAVFEERAVGGRYPVVVVDVARVSL